MSEKIKYWEPSKQIRFNYATGVADGAPKTHKTREINIKIQPTEQIFKRIK